MAKNSLAIRLENVNLGSNSGPNSFAAKLNNKFIASGHTIHNGMDYDVALCFIEDCSNLPPRSLYQRLDGIYFNTAANFELQNKNILATYKKSQGVIFQSNFNKKLTEVFFGEHKNSTVIHNGTDLEFLDTISPLENAKLDKYENVWSCAASWRPHKRLKANIEYFLQHKGDNDCLVVAGKPDYLFKDPNVFYVGNLKQDILYSLYKRSKYFLHLAWLDHCPNVVVDARASGCRVVCSSNGGTKEIAGPDAIVIQEHPWDFKPTKLYSPPEMDFNNKVKNSFDACYDMKNVAEKYLEFMQR